MASEPKVGNLYFMMKYADEEFTRPIIDTYEYKGREPKDADDLEFVFEDIASGDELVLRERDLKYMVDVSGLIEQLQQFHTTGRGAEDAS